MSVLVFVLVFVLVVEFSDKGRRQDEHVVSNATGVASIGASVWMMEPYGMSAAAKIPRPMSLGS